MSYVRTAVVAVVALLGPACSDGAALPVDSQPEPTQQESQPTTTVTEERWFGSRCETLADLDYMIAEGAPADAVQNCREALSDHLDEIIEDLEDG